MPGGRPFGTTKLKDDDATPETIKALAKIQCAQHEAAAILKVHSKTFDNYLRNKKRCARRGKMAAKRAKHR
jgi:hypothetical protein